MAMALRILIGEDLAVAALKAGAHDYIMKDRLARLVPAVERAIREAGERRERRHTRTSTTSSDRSPSFPRPNSGIGASQ